MTVHAQLRTYFVATMMAILPLALMGACGDDEAAVVNPASTGVTTGAGGSTTGTGICLLNNCSSNDHCAGCSDGRTTCLVAESRCVACDPNQPLGQQGCPAGQECSPYGLCVPEGTSCPTDNDGNPTITCTKNQDCQACSPMHQVCDTATGKCQACTPTNTQHCLQSDICVEGKCSPKCPQSCTIDNDCSQCGGPGNEAHACFQHKCAQCSDTFPCAAGLQCINGVCIPPCGLPGPDAGTCQADEDCQFCGDPNAMVKWKCDFPINGANHGTCKPPANGCSDLGQGVAVLPAPYDAVTQLCSNDEDCAGEGIDFNVGKAIRDLVGKDELDLGFTKITINDAVVTYPMPECASVSITNNIDCGVCVPCKEDGDCMAVPIDPLIPQLFKDDALAQIAAALLFDLLWGDIPDHNLNFFCQPVAGGYGVCIPCGNPLQPCGGGGSGGGDGSGMCDHDVCTAGGPLLKSCGTCADTVCSSDSFCCDTEWDDLCVQTADQMCGGICTGGGGSACAHDPCTAGDALDQSCNMCVSAICADDPFCCNSTSGSWDSLCVGFANDTTTYPACANACMGGCAHSECDQGAALDSTCSACATAICAADDYCCNTEWDALCVTDAEADDTNCSCP